MRGGRRRARWGWLSGAPIALVLACYQGDFIDLACDRQGTCIGGATEAATDATSTSTSSDASGSDSSSDTATAPPLDAYRLTVIDVADPHFYYDFGGCKDVSALINSSAATDIDAGKINLILLFDPADPSAAEATMWLTEGECVVGVDKTTCGYKNPDVLVTTVATNSQAAACDVRVPGTANPSYAPPSVAQPPCFTTPRGTVILPPLIAALPPIVLYDAQLSAGYPGDAPPVDALIDGLITGFIPQSQAMQIEGQISMLPFNFWATIAGGGGCQLDPNLPIDDTDANLDPQNLERGVQLHLNFHAERVEWID